MPELPEVETVRTGLEAAVKGAFIANVELRRANLRTPFADDFAEKLAGKKIQAVGRRSKYLVFELSGGISLIAHLGMSGCFSLHKKAPSMYGKHDHVIFHLKGGHELVFTDPRRFGLMEIANTKTLKHHPLFKSLGPEPLEKEFSVTYLKSMLTGRKAPIKPLLMDAHIVVGVGNIYASEALFDAGIDPRKPASAVVDKAPVLIASIRKVLRAAIASGGSSLRDFFDADGNTGYFQHHFKVYGKVGKPCERCGHLIHKLTQAGRSTFFCMHCQR